ncbi:conserved hypothetical protein [uncultured Pleomorphomonas sp.]|uniref:DUF2946 domain-containing protein n=1 Tax=uncultured Pleomorphomonas sp. TaxID=442121 RepID=A0A212LDK7_9HYPH|nr:DUF2946 family protein [uncultured Pleomorphomonas sp.]SCM75643.1 conserved hypothetical protein [uncultured Pleomorphomonas sp.]
MAGAGRRQGLGDLARDVVRVLFAYALVLQTLAPLAVAQADARDGLGGHSVLCSAMAGTDAQQPAKAPARIVHDCLSCCLGSVAGVLPAPAELPEPARFPLLAASFVSEAPALPARAGSPPPQRAPPGFA